MDYVKTIVNSLRALLVASVAHGVMSEAKAQNADPEQQAWDRARQARTPEAYQNYLDRYPAGRYAVDAFREIVSGALPAAGPPGQLQSPGGGGNRAAQPARSLY